MAHLPPGSAIFSPSVARAAASAAKDWNFVDAWLATRFRGKGPPPFERNPDTLRALLALVALNESADEDRDLLARAEARALRDADAADDERIRRAEEREEIASNKKRAAAAQAGDDGDERTMPPPLLADVREDVLDSLEESLPREGRAALEAAAGAAVELGIARPDAEAVGRAVVDLQARADELERAHARVGVLRRHVDAESDRLAALAAELAGDDYRPPPDLARTNLDTQRALRAGAARLPELVDRAASLAAAAGGTPDPTVEQVRHDEEEYLSLLARKKELDAQVKSFRGLPPNTDAARRELEGLRSELRQITQRRDAVFEGLVERETPRKPRR